MPIRGIEQLHAKLERFRKALLVTAPKRVAADAERFYKDSFKNQGFTDRTFRRWAPTKKGKPGRILKGKTGFLMNSVRAEAHGMSIRVSAGGSQIRYAKIHNEGGTIEGTVNVRAHTRKKFRTSRKVGNRRAQMTRLPGKVRAHSRSMLIYMARRQFIGRSAVLETKLKARIVATIYEAVR